MLTRAQTRKWGGAVDLPESDLGSLLSSDEAQVSKGPSGPKVEVRGNETLVDLDSIKLPITREQLISTQRSDPSLEQYFDLVANPEACKTKSAVFFLDDALLMRRWSCPATEGMDWGVVNQVVVRAAYRNQVLALAHENPWSGHLGITKTYDRILKHFFWPKLKTSVAQYC